MFNFDKKIKNRNSEVKTEAARRAYGTASSIVGIITNLFLFLIKLFAGALTGSIAMVADALNNFTDSASSVITLISFKIAAKPADSDHPFGHARIEYISSMAVSFLILLVGAEMFVDSVKLAFGLSESKIEDVGVFSLVILLFAIAAKLGLGLYYYNVSKTIDSMVIRAAAIDSFTDSISTTGILLSLLIIKHTGLNVLDAIIGGIVSVLIILPGAKMLSATKNALLGEAPKQEMIDELTAIIKEFPMVMGIHELMIHNYGPRKYFASFHAEVSGDSDVYAIHDAIDRLEKRIMDEMGILCTIHIDPTPRNESELRQK